MSAEETYDLKASLQIVCKWCGQQNIFLDDLLYDLKLILADSKYRIIAFNGPPDDGKRFLFTSLIGAGLIMNLSTLVRFVFTTHHIETMTFWS